MFMDWQSWRLPGLGHNSSDLAQKIKVRSFNLLCEEYVANHRPGRTECEKKKRHELICKTGRTNVHEKELK